jgi:hypothetical protein
MVQAVTENKNGDPKAAALCLECARKQTFLTDVFISDLQQNTPFSLKE